MPLVKICGITNLDDARAAIEAGADMLGFNFYRPSPRFIEPAKARAIIEKMRTAIEGLEQQVTSVGVFVNEASPEVVLKIADEAGVRAVQLHGDESIEFCRSLKSLMKDRFLIKVLRVSRDSGIDRVEKYDVDAIMLDAFDRDVYGGTGRVIDWSMARRARELTTRLFLAGGLSPDNVAEAIAAVQPYAVDACSGLESSLGVKDPERMKGFVRAVRGE